MYDLMITVGGNSALEAADDMVKIADHVYLVSPTQLTGDQVLIGEMNGAQNMTVFLKHEVVEIKKESFVSGIRIRDLKGSQGRELQASDLLIEVGLTHRYLQRLS